MTGLSGSLRNRPALFDAVNILQSYVRLVDSSLARSATAESKRG